MLVLSSTLPRRLVAPVLCRIASASEVLPAPPCPKRTMLRMSLVLATFESPRNFFPGFRQTNDDTIIGVWRTRDFLDSRYWILDAYFEKTAGSPPARGQGGF